MADIVPPSRRVGILHFALVGAAAFTVIYVLCWLGAYLGFGAASHMYLALFTTAAITSVPALLQGLCLSLGFGALFGAVIAIFFNLFRFLAPA